MDNARLFVGLDEEGRITIIIGDDTHTVEAGLTPENAREMAVRLLSMAEEANYLFEED